MKLQSICYLACSLALLLVGCAGKNFVRPAHSELFLGKTTSAEIKARFGKPLETARALENGTNIQVFTYGFASMDWGSLKPARIQTFSFCDDKLVGYAFSSSFKGDNTDFDSAKVSQIKKDVTTRAEVEQLLGPPGGKMIFPIVKNAEDDGILYLYNQTRGVPFGVKVYNKSLAVSFNPKGIVTDVVFFEEGEK